MEPELTLPEVKNPDNWFGRELPWRDKERRLLTYLYYPVNPAYINTNLASRNEIKSYYDFIEPKWKGKIIVGDAQETGQPFNNFAFTLVNNILDLDYFRKLVKQGPIVRDRVISSEWLARGKYAISMGAAAGDLSRYIQAGVPLEPVSVKEGTYLAAGGSGVVLLNQRPHPNSARLFVNWLFSKEAQVIVQKQETYQSARTDIGTEGVDPAHIRNPEVKYFPAVNLNREWVINESDKYFKLAREIWGAQ